MCLDLPFFSLVNNQIQKQNERMLECDWWFYIDRLRTLLKIYVAYPVSNAQKHDLWNEARNLPRFKSRETFSKRVYINLYPRLQI